MTSYQTCEIRGHAAHELTPDLFRRWGRILGGWVGPGAKFVVGGDLRDSTGGMLAGLIEGLCRARVDCIDLGRLPTPMIHHARRRLRAAGSAAVTASHEPAEINGLSWVVLGQPSADQQTAELLAAALPPDHPGEAAAPRTLDISFDYVASLQETWCDALRARQHIVLDPMHGSWSGRARRYLHAIFPECLISVIRDQCDPQFGGRSPDCSQPEHLQELCQAVYRHRAHLGIAFDGDGDCLTVVDDRGIPLGVEETAWMLLRSFGRKLRGRRFVYDQQLSDRLPEAARQLGAEPLGQRSDRSAIRARMRESNAALGADARGHYFFADLGGEDDALFAACSVVTLLHHSGKTLSKLRRRCPRVFMTPELQLSWPGGCPERALDQIGAAWAKCPQSAVDGRDGLRIDLPGGWALVRKTTASPALSFRFESSDWTGLDDVVRRFCDSLPAQGSELWKQYQDWAVGGE